MKVLFANKFFFRNGGSEVVMFQERDYLQEQGHQAVDFSMRDERNYESAYAESFVSRQYYRGGRKLGQLRAMFTFVHSPEAVNKIGALIDRTRPDLVHCHNIYHQLTPSIISAAKRRGIPVVLTLHDYKLVCPTYNRLRHGQPCSKCLDGNFRQVLSNRCADGPLVKSLLLYAEAVVQRHLGSYEMVDAFIAPSRYMADAISHRIPKERVRLLYNGVDLSKITASSRDDGYVLYLGRLSAEKGVETLLRAHAVSQFAWNVRIAGTGPLEALLRSGYPRAEYLGHLSGTELSAAVAKASVVVVPSEWYENCPMSVLEAMAYGKPVVGSRMGGIPELVADGKTGMLFEAGNVLDLQEKLGTLMSSASLRQAMGNAARMRIEQEFSLDQHNAGLMAIYESLVRM